MIGQLYRLFKNNCLYIERVNQDSDEWREGKGQSGKNPVMVAAGKKAALARNEVHTFEEHLEKPKSEILREVLKSLQEYILGLDPAIEEVPKKLYVAYRTTENIVCAE